MVGRVLRNHGLDGTLRIQSLSDNPNRFAVGESLTVGDRAAIIDSYQHMPNGQALLGLRDLPTPVAQSLGGEWIFAPVGPTDDLQPDEYYHYQLIGLCVVTDEGETLGTVREILATGSNDVYVVRPDTGSEILLPAISQVVKHIDLDAGTMLVHLLSGLR